MSEDPPEDTLGDTPGERGERVAKWLSRAGAASRRDAERLVTEGRVKLNGEAVTHPATFVQPGDLVQLDDAVLDQPERTRLFRYHKPDGLVTTHRDERGRPTVFQKLPANLPRLISVGRLDLGSEGLLLLTNDGALARRLELPENGWLRRYRVRVNGQVDERALAALARGVEVDGVRYGPIEAGLDSRRGDNAWLTVSLREGRNREIRRVMLHLGLQVSRLIRLAYGPFQLGNLAKGAVEEVTGKVLREQLSGVPKPRRRDANPPRTVTCGCGLSRQVRRRPGGIRARCRPHDPGDADSGHSGGAETCDGGQAEQVDQCRRQQQRGDAAELAAGHEGAHGGGHLAGTRARLAHHRDRHVAQRPAGRGQHGAQHQARQHQARRRERRRCGDKRHARPRDQPGHDDLAFRPLRHRTAADHEQRKQIGQPIAGDHQAERPQAGPRRAGQAVALDQQGNAQVEHRLPGAVQHPRTSPSSHAAACPGR